MIDNYCERIDASFWSEPVNALTNIAFVIAGICAFYLLSKQQSKAIHLKVLAGFMIVIGIGSFLFHTFANQWSLFADVIPIYIFQLIFLWAYQRYLLTFSIAQIVTVYVLFIACIIFTRYLPFNINGSEMYLPTIAIMILFSFAAKIKNKCIDRQLLIACALFSVALIMRSIDEGICQHLPLGTHFGWHILNAGVLFLSWYSLFLNANDKQTSVIQ